MKRMKPSNGDFLPAPLPRLRYNENFSGLKVL